MRVYGHSMAPLIRPGDLVLVDDAAYASRAPRSGEVVAVRPMSVGGPAFIKRIAGLPHERMRDGDREWQLGDDEFFVLADHAGHGFDSRVFGPVTRGELIGPVRARIWPWRILQRTHT